MVIINPSIKDISWKSEESYIFVHKNQINSIPTSLINSLSLKGHIWLMTSGTLGQKYVALPKKACIFSAQAVNEHLKVSKEDCWILALPSFHIGGLAILTRSFLSQSKVHIMEQKWNASIFCSLLKKHKVTLASLVPTQVYDLIQEGHKPPSSLRAVIVGGGALHPTLYLAARKNHWPLLPSYGLTEAASQVATASLSSLKEKQYPLLQILKPFNVSIKEGSIYLKSKCLFTGYLQRNGSDEEWHWVKYNSSQDFHTMDKGSQQGLFLQVQGRRDVIKILGKNVSLDYLENILLQILMELKAPLRYFILDHSHPRSGHQIDLVTDYSDLPLLTQVRENFNKAVLPYEQIKDCYFISKISKGHLSKVKTNIIKTDLGY